jgi:hypothetical protein
MTEFSREQDFFRMVLEELILNLCNVIGEGMTIGLASKATKEAISAFSNHDQDSFKFWNSFSKITSTPYEIKGNTKRLYRCSFETVDKKSLPIFCQVHKSYLEGLLGTNIDLDNAILKNGNYCDFAVSDIRLVTAKSKIILPLSGYSLQKLCYLGPLLGLVNYMKKDFSDYEKYLRDACEKAGIRFVAQFEGRPRAKAKIDEFVSSRNLGPLNVHSWLWKSIYYKTADKMGLKDKDEILAKLTACILSGLLKHHGKETEITTQNEDGRWVVKWGDKVCFKTN